MIIDTSFLKVEPGIMNHGIMNLGSGFIIGIAQKIAKILIECSLKSILKSH